MSNSLDKNSASAAQALQQALLSGKIKFKKSKYDMPEPQIKKQHSANGNRSGKAIFGAPAKHEPKMDYINAQNQQTNSFLPAIQDFLKEKNIKKSHNSVTKETKKKDDVNNMIDDLLKSVKP